MDQLASDSSRNDTVSCQVLGSGCRRGHNNFSAFGSTEYKKGLVTVI